MKKIYSLLLLGAFMLLGAESVMATDYYYRGWLSETSDSWTTATAAQKFTATETTGIYYFVVEDFVAGSAFKITDGTTGWTGTTYNSGNIDMSRSNLNVYGGDGGNICVTFPSESTTDIKVYLDVRDLGNVKVYVEALDFKVVTFYVASNEAKHLHAYNSSSYNYTGNWPGVQLQSTKVTVNGISYYKRDVAVPSGSNMTFILSSNGSNQTTGQSVGTINNNTSVFCTVGKNNGIASLKYSKDSWASAHDFTLTNNKQSVSLTKGEVLEFKILFDSQWCGGTGDEKTIISGSSTQSLTYNGGTDFKITAPIAGDYEIACGYDQITVAFPYSREVTEDMYGTICLPTASSAFTGMNVYEVKGKVMDGVNVSGIALQAHVGQLVAGVPYVFLATDDEIAVTCTGAAVDAVTTTGLVGNLSGADVFVPVNSYILTTTGLRKVVSANTGKVKNNYAYFDISALPTIPVLAPGMRIIEVADGATDIDAIEASETAVKFVENDQLFIRRAGIVYDMTGRIVK